MLLLDKWTLTDTLALLSHPERARFAAVKDTETEKTQDNTDAYAEAYRELMDELSEDHSLVWKR